MKHKLPPPVLTMGGGIFVRYENHPAPAGAPLQRRRLGLALRGLEKLCKKTHVNGIDIRAVLWYDWGDEDGGWGGQRLEEYR
ncbi:MAG: hypothetical protein FWD35_00005 [Oscillospiraceae bacterium]|nr:hypothetical protein [Oscillospiraceae bacterium]